MKRPVVGVIGNEVLAENRFREKAGVLGESLRNAGGVARAADAISRFTAGITSS